MEFSHIAYLNWFFFWFSFRIFHCCLYFLVNFHLSFHISSCVCICEYDYECILPAVPWLFMIMSFCITFFLRFFSRARNRITRTACTRDTNERPIQIQRFKMCDVMICSVSTLNIGWICSIWFVQVREI